MELKIIPRISEKTYAQAQSGMYVFNVPITATKAQVTDAIATRYDVAVVAVNMLIAKGKAKQGIRKGGARVSGRRSDVKKAYVRLAEGQTLPVFAEANTPAAEPAKEKK